MGQNSLKKTNIVIFTDLDGTLLDARTYDPGVAIEALEKCSLHSIPVIFVSSKTRAEIECLREELNNVSPFRGMTASWRADRGAYGGPAHSHPTRHAYPPASNG